MEIYTCNKFTGFYPVGSAAVVEATSPEEAAEKLNAALVAHGLEGDAKAEDMILFINGVRILCDGEY